MPLLIEALRNLQMTLVVSVGLIVKSFHIALVVLSFVLFLNWGAAEFIASLTNHLDLLLLSVCLASL